ncbi:hypothetical protein PV779_51520 [Streptomyces sp. ID01-9D]|nr:hypothetical protein [Streptomyces sp. ID01-9D]
MARGADRTVPTGSRGTSPWVADGLADRPVPRKHGSRLPRNGWGADTIRTM